MKHSKSAPLSVGADGGSRTRTPIRTQAPQACQSTSSSTSAKHSLIQDCLTIIASRRPFVNSFFRPANFCGKRAKKLLTQMPLYGNISLALNSAKPLARVVELVDSLASGASVRKDVRVRLPPRAPERQHRKQCCRSFCFPQINQPCRPPFWGRHGWFFIPR